MKSLRSSEQVVNDGIHTVVDRHLDLESEDASHIRNQRILRRLIRKYRLKKNDEMV